MTLPVITLIGAGNMGTCLVSGLLKNGHPAGKVWVTDPSNEKLRYMQETFRVYTTTDNTRGAQAGDVIIFAIKPQIFPAVAAELAGAVHARKPLIISIAAGVREASIQAWLGDPVPIVRAMPNIPALIGCGATALYANSLVSAEHHALAESIMRAIGVTVWLENEALLNIATALSGSGPAYFFHMMEALQLTAEELGMPKESARLLTLQTALGAARMAMESGKSLEELRRQVTSPGGTTEKAISVLEEHHVAALYKKAMQAANLRSEELADFLGEKK